MKAPVVTMAGQTGLFGTKVDLATASEPAHEYTLVIAGAFSGPTKIEN